ncbi:hypothetical protein ACF0H5_022079 [Mactra antiquata]
MAVCVRAPPCCPGDVCRAFQRRDASRPVAACARSLTSRPLYAPGSQAQQRICGLGAVAAGPQSLLRGRPQFGRRPMPPGFGQPQTRIGREGSIGGVAGIDRGMAASGLRSWDNGMQQLPQRFPNQGMGMSGQDPRGQMPRSLGEFPPMPPMPSFSDPMPQSDFRSPSRQLDRQGMGAQANTFAPLPGQDGFGRGQRSFGGFNDQMFGSAGSVTSGQGQQFPSSQFPSGFSAGQSIQSAQGFSSGSMQSGQGFSSGPMQSGQGFSSGSMQSGQGFSSGSMQAGQRFPSGGMQPGQGFSSGGMQTGQPSFDQSSTDMRQPMAFGGQGFGGQQFSGQSFGGGQSFGSIPGGVPQPFLAEQPPITATSISGGSSQSSASSTQP